MPSGHRTRTTAKDDDDSMTSDRTNAPARRSPRLAWILAGASVAIVVLIAVIVFAPHDATETGPTGSGAASDAATPTPTQSIAEQLIVPGYDPNPGTFALPDASGLSAEPVTANFALADDATAWGGTFGLSFEATELANPAWNSDNSNLTTTLAALGDPVVRFGGNKVDRRMWWTSTDEPAPEWAEATVTPADLERVAAVAEAVDADVTLVVDLGHNDPDRAADMVKYATAAFGDHLLAITIGNEPNGYSPEAQPDLAVRGDDWDTDAYQDALVEYSDAIDAETPGTNYAGPGAYDTTWLRAYTESDLPNKAAVTMHWYPLWRCDATSNQSSTTTIENLTSPALRESAHKILGLGKGVADDAGLPFWVEETGPTSCSGGNETSRTHAQALWTSDYVLTAAEIGAERIAFHSMLGACDGGAPMSPVCASGTVDAPGEVIEGRSNFLALMLLSWVPDGQVLTPTVSGDGSVMVHGVYGDDGSLTYVIVDMRDPSATDALAPVSLHAPEGLGADAPAAWTPDSGSQLASDALDSTESTLPAMAPVQAELAGSTLTADAPLTVASTPGTTTVLTFDDATSHADGDGPTASASATATP
jgi:hypothetical protein